MATKKAPAPAKKAAPAKPKAGDGKAHHGKPMTHCEAKAAHRKAQNKYVGKDPKAQANRVAKSAAKSSTKAGKGGGSGGGGKGGNGKQGKHGHTMGRPRKAC